MDYKNILEHLLVQFPKTIDHHLETELFKTKTPFDPLSIGMIQNKIFFNLALFSQNNNKKYFFEIKDCLETLMRHYEITKSIGAQYSIKYKIICKCYDIKEYIKLAINFLNAYSILNDIRYFNTALKVTDYIISEVVVNDKKDSADDNLLPFMIIILKNICCSLDLLHKRHS